MDNNNNIDKKKKIIITAVCILLCALSWAMQYQMMDEYMSAGIENMQTTQATPTKASYQKQKTSENAEKKVIISESAVNDLSYNDFVNSKIDTISTVYYDSDKAYVYAVDGKNNYYKIANPESVDFKESLLKKGITVKELSDIHVKTKAERTAQAKSVFSFVLTVGGFLFLIYLMSAYIKKQEKGKLAVTMITSDNRSATGTSNNLKTFSEVAGLAEVKRDMASLVDFLKNKDKYEKAGAKLPKGVILYGPPGTGKTTIAKAVAGEANVNFIAANGSDFVEMYVGVGAKRVRELFEQAKKNAPCIIFLDELDAIGGSRKDKNSSSEDRKTLNALLSAMDGFHDSENILVIGATNRIEDLDDALLRPGRFTNRYCVPLPETAADRMAIIEMYSANKKYDSSVSLETLAKETIGFSPAKIEALINEAAIISVQKKRDVITREDLESATYKLLLSGHEVEDQDSRSKEELQIVAWHEAGHALLGMLNNKEVNKVTIISSTSGAGGVTFTTPQKRGLLSYSEMRQEVSELYAGRIAELVFFGENDKVTTGASNDIERATRIIRQMVEEFGMTSEFGLLNLDELNADDRSILQKEVELAKDIEEETKGIINENYDKLKMIAEELLEKETIRYDDLKRIMES